ncbi:MAG: ferric reductase-like transmembrane domain-containing protein [Solirubrobacterales bacterium]
MIDLIQTGGLFWVTSRAAGTAALVLASLAVGFGLLSSSRGSLGRKVAELRPLHEALSLATLGAALVHGLALLGDQYVGYSPAEIAVPFASNYQTIWTGLGVISFWGLAALGLSYYQRKRIGPARWRYLHRFTSIFWLLGLVHSLGMGTDRGAPWFLIMAGVTAAPALLLLLWRVLEPSTPPAASRVPQP